MIIQKLSKLLQNYRKKNSYTWVILEIYEVKLNNSMANFKNPKSLFLYKIKG